MPPQKIQCDILIDDCTLLNKDFKIEAQVCGRKEWHN